MNAEIELPTFSFSAFIASLRFKRLFLFGRGSVAPCSFVFLMFSGCCHFDRVNAERSQLIARLQNEMLNQTDWLRIHAAEALLDHGQSAHIVELFKPEADAALPPYRIGVWRVLARGCGATLGPLSQTLSGTLAETPQNSTKFATKFATKERKQDRWDQLYVERIRSVLRDPAATDRISAAESLGKLDVANPRDDEMIAQWLTTADDATAVFPRWLLCLSSSDAKRDDHETALAKYLSSPDAIARLRAGFVLGRLKNISPNSLAALRHQLNLEPADSIARVYLITAVLLHSNETTETEPLKKQLIPYLHGKVNEQLEAGIILGMVGNETDLRILRPNLRSPEPDARIGAANGMLRLLK